MRLPARLIHWPSDEPAPRGIFFGAAADERHDEVEIVELTLTGVRLLTPEPLEIGAKVLIQLPMLEPLKARVIWVSKRIAGCHFRTPLHPALFRIIAAGAQRHWAA